ncbi:MAG: hypothetical protein AB7I30_09570 [Isosphaeraceae bacterium]
MRLLVSIVVIASEFAATQAAESSTPELAASIAASHRELLHYPGGVEITFSLRAVQDSKTAHFLWSRGEGNLTWRWPRLLCRFKGRKVNKPEEREREGEYDFESRVGAGRDEMFAQITPYRQGWSAVHAFPLRLGFFEEFDQYHVPGKRLDTDYWLPSALTRGEFRHDGEAILDGIRCEVFRRADGGDALWVAPDQGFVVCRREIRDPRDGVLREVVVNRKLVRLSDRLWLPTEQIQEVYHRTARITKDTGQPTYTLHVTIDRIKKGHVDFNNTYISIPDGCLVQDDVIDVTYRKGLSSEAQFRSSLKGARSLLRRAPAPTRSRPATRDLAVVFSILTLCNVAAVVQSRRSATPRGPKAGAAHGDPRSSPSGRLHL